MKVKTGIGLAMLVILFMLAVGTTFAASTVTLKDSYVEKILTYREEGESWYEEYAAGKVAATFNLDLSSIFPSTRNITQQFKGDTCFDISLGAIEESFCLGDGGDVKYTAGKTSATITRKEDIGEERGKWITYMKTTVKWTAKNILTIKVSGKPDWVGWVLADYYDGVTEDAIQDITQASVTVSGTFTDKNDVEITECYASSDISVTGKATTKTIAKGKGDYQEEFELTTVTLAGTGVATITHNGEEWTLDSFTGPWLLTADGTAAIYVISDGVGSITEWGAFGALDGAYDVAEDGSFSATLDQEGGDPLVLEGSFTSSNTIDITNPVPGTMRKISDASACSGRWSGTFDETEGETVPIDFNLGSDGSVTNFSGITGPVTGRMFCEAGTVVAFFRTGEDIGDPYNQIGLEGIRTVNSITGSLYLDDGGEVSGTFALVKQ
jgi:hypothetical protein